MSIPSFRRILVAVDVDEGAPAALEMTRRMADLSAGEVHLIHVVVPNELEDLGSKSSSKATAQMSGSDWAERAARGKIETLAGTHLGGRSIPPADVRFGYAVDVAPIVLEAASELGVDLLVVATHGRRGLRRMALGSVAERLVRESPIPVLSVRAGGGQEEKKA